MRKVEMVARIDAETELTNTKEEEAVETILATIKAGLHQGEPVILRGLGTFAVRAKRARLGRNPKTGTAAEIPARRVVAFKAGKLFKQAVAAVVPPAAPAPPSRRAVTGAAAPRPSRAVPYTPERPSPPGPLQDVRAGAPRQRQRPRSRAEGGSHADR